VTVRVWVYALLALLVVPGLAGIEAWPLTEWRLFSLSRDASQTDWALDAVTADGTETIDLEQLPLAFRNAAWPLAELPRASTARREEVCLALLDGVRTVRPAADRLRLVRERRRMAGVDGEPTISADREVVHECGA
jgi:hypothetical protein